jgi:hypothetical protein
METASREAAEAAYEARKNGKAAKASRQRKKAPADSQRQAIPGR